MTQYVQVSDAEGNALGKTKPARARKLLRAGRAKIAKQDPFTIKLTDKKASPEDTDLTTEQKTPCG